MTTGKISLVVPESANAVSVSQSASGVIGVGLATATTGSLELRNGSSGALLASVPMGAPVRDVVAGANGSTFYVLNGGASSSSVTLVNSTTDHRSVSVPVPLDTDAIAIEPSGQDLFALGSTGQLVQVNIGSGTVAAQFSVGKDPLQLAVSSNGSTVYVLNGVGTGTNVGVIDIATERQIRVLPAPANCLGIEISLDGQSLYDIVGTPAYGNVQVFPLGS